MFSRLLAALLLLATPALAQTTAQGGARVNSGGVLNVAPNAPISVTITPSTQTISTGNTQAFVATVNNDILNAGVQWSFSGPTCVLANDQFTRPNQNPLGSPWINSGGLQLLNNSITATTTNNFGIASYDGGISWPNDQFSQAVLKNAVANAGQLQLVVREPDLNNWYTFYIPNAGGGVGQGGGVHIGRVVTGVLTPLVDGGVTLLSIGDVFKFQVVGNQLSAFQNGNLILTTTDNTFASGRPGIIVNTTSASSVSDLSWGAWTGGSAGCGSINPSFSRSGDTVIYTAPGVLPSNPSITITATSVQDPTKSGSAVVTIAAAGPPPSAVVNLFTGNTIPKQPGAASNTFPVPTSSVGDLAVVFVTAKDGANITGVSNSLGQSFTDSGCQGDQASQGHSAIFFRYGSVASTINAITVTSTGTTGANIDIGYLIATVGNSTQPNAAATCNGGAGPTNNPVGPSITTTIPGSLVVSDIVVGGDTNGVQSPFTFKPLDRGDGAAYTIPANTGSFAPSWTTTGFGWAGTTVAFGAGTQPPSISVSLSPTSTNTQVNATQVFTVTLVNDNTNAGANITRAGAGCAGATCGTVSPAGPIKSGGTFTYTGPAAVPSPALVTITATSIADGSKTGTAAVTVTAAPPVVVNVSPTSLSTSAGAGGTSFTAAVTNDIGAQGVTWVLSGVNCTTNCGSISSTNTLTTVYTPPASASSNLNANLIATSVADNTKSFTVPITITMPVQPPPGCGASGCPAFPGAQGGGAEGQGGRGGTVFEVTNNNPSGAGSLNACVSATGPRRCIFRVAGIFPGGLFASQPFLDVDGQSAPGEVIIGGPNTPGDAFRISTHDVTVRYVTVSPDNRNVLSGPQGGTSGFVIINCAAINNQLGTGGCYNDNLDHVTARWAGNKNIAVFSNFTPGAPDCQSNCNGPNHKISISWFLQYEPHAGHPVGIGNGTDESGTGSVSQLTFETDQDWFMGLLVNTSHRIPEGPMMRNRWQNMIVYNWSFFSMASLGTQFLDVINSKWVSGNLNSQGPAQSHPIHISDCSAQSAISCSITPSVYLSGNIGPGATTPAADQFTLADQVTCENCDGVGPVPANWRRTTPISTPLKFPITANPAVNLDGLILPTVGNSQHLDCLGNWVSHRDQSDSRIIAQYQNNTSGAFWPNATYPPIQNQTSPNQIPVPTSQWTDVPVVGFPVCTESQHDGIPDAWKTKYGLSLSNPNLGNQVDNSSGSGFTYVEEYLGGLVPKP
jgi:hypothetical protein